MAFIEWDDNLSVYIVEIDRQHKKLIAMINELHDAMRHRQSKLVLSQIIEGLIGYAGTHFRTEERYFERYGYPEEIPHKQEHAAFTLKVAEFKHNYDAGKFGLSMDLLDFLSDWLQNHIKVVDRKYALFFNEKGLK